MGKFLQNLSLGRLGRRWKDNIKMSDVRAEGGRYFNAELSRSVSTQLEMRHPIDIASTVRLIFKPIFYSLKMRPVCYEDQGVY